MFLTTIGCSGTGDDMSRAFSIRIFLPDGVPDGLRLVEKSNWTGLGVVFPRAIFSTCKSRLEFARTGVYVLVGPPEEGDIPMIYVGEGDPVRPRLEQHHAKKDFWTWAIFFVSKDTSLNKAHVQHLEARLLQLASDAKRSRSDNRNAAELPALSEAEQADTESFLTDMLSIFPLVGLTVFEKAQTSSTDQRVPLFIKSKGVEARGYETAQGFLVESGAGAVVADTPTLHPYMSEIRKQLREQGILVEAEGHLQFTQDYLFSSPSTAAGVVLARSANGRTEWKDVTGKTLRQLQEGA